MNTNSEENKVEVNNIENSKENKFKTKAKGVVTKLKTDNKFRIKFILAIICICILIFAYFIFLHNRNLFGVAAKVGNVEISEQKVTDAVNKFRQDNNLEDTDKWNSYLDENDQLSSNIRLKQLDSLIESEVVNQVSVSENITVDDDAINKQVAIMKKNLGSDENFNKYLENNNISYSGYVESLRMYMVKQKTKRYMSDATDITDSLKSSFYNSYKDQLNSGKGYYKLVFSSSEQTDANNVLNQLKSGNTTLKDEATKLSKKDTSSSQKTYPTYSFIENSQIIKDTLANLQNGQISDLVVDGDKIYILGVVDQINSENISSFDDLSSYTQENIILYLRDSYQNELYKKELQNWMNKIGVIKYDMPFNCPYKRNVFWIN